MFSASTTELYFPKPHNRVITNTVKFTNSTNIDAIVKMRTTSREKFHVRPRIFVIKRGETVEVSVSSRVLPSDIPEIDKSDECHAVIHQYKSSASTTTASSSSKDSNILLTPEALQLFWDAGSNLGRVVLRCHVEDPPANHKISFVAASAGSRNVSKSPSIPRNTSEGTAPYNNAAHSRDASDISVSSNINAAANNNGKPPLSNANAASSAHSQFQKDAEIQQYLNAAKNNTNNQQQQQQQVIGGGAALEKFSEKVQGHEQALDRSVQQLSQLSATAKAAAQNVRNQVQGREDRKFGGDSADGEENKIVSKTGRIKRVPLSVAIFFMVLAFVAGVLMKQSAYQHFLDTTSNDKISSSSSQQQNSNDSGKNNKFKQGITGDL